MEKFELCFVLYPVHGIESALASWTKLGFKELWRVSEESVFLGHGNSNFAQIMLEDHPDEHALGAGPMFVVDDLDSASESIEGSPDWRVQNLAIPMGRYSVFLTDTGVPVRLLEVNKNLAEKSIFYGS